MQISNQPTAGSAEPTRFIEMVFPEHANHYGTLFGGHALSLMGKAAFVAATRRARCAVVMRPPTRSNSTNRFASASSSSSMRVWSGSAARR